MNTKFFILAFFVFVACVFAFDNSTTAIGEKIDNDLTSPNIGFFSRYKRANKKCRRFPGCVQFMCNRCCGNCNKADCVTGMCFLCCR